MFAALSSADAMHDRSLIKTMVPIVDAVLMPNGNVRLFTQHFEAFTADPKADAWRSEPPEILADSNAYTLKRIGRVLHLGNVVVVGGNVFGHVSGRDVSAVLRSSDHGMSFQVIEIGADTLATSDGIASASNGMIFFLDRVGRLWTSNDTGRTWDQTPLPKPIPPGGAREIDMVNDQHGVCIDVQRRVYLTTNFWQKVMEPVPSKRPILRTQPTFLDEFQWNRSLVLWTSSLILTEGSDIYRTQATDLVWERWDNVVRYAISSDRSAIAYFDTKGRLWTATSFTASPTLIAEGELPPEFIRFDGTSIITYRADTGPIVYAGGRKTMIRPYHPTAKIERPQLEARNKAGQGWGIDVPVPSSTLVDILRSDKGTSWRRDTVIPIGPIRKVQVLDKDTVVFGDLSNKHHYDPVKRTSSPFTVKEPLAEFMKQPIVRFRVMIAADELDSTHVRWAEFRPSGPDFRCAEIVDSSRFGVTSSLVDVRIPISDITTLLSSVNKAADNGLSPGIVTRCLQPEVRQAYGRLLDTLFVYDAYFNTFDLYIPPPTPEVQAAECRTYFERIVDTIPSLQPHVIEEAILAWRHLPRDEFSRYAVVFENKRGKSVTFTAERMDEAHGPMMMPWVGTSRGWDYYIFDTALTDLVLRAVPEQEIPERFTMMSRPEWLLAAVAAYIDMKVHGRWHRWMNHPVNKEARR